jgi:APA family basic amino acid/polyamine antiporter
MCRDGLPPERLATVWEKTRTPVIVTVVFAVPIACLAAFAPLTEIASWSTSAPCSPSSS